LQAGPPQVLRKSLNMRVLSKKSWTDIAIEDPKLSAQITERVRSRALQCRIAHITSAMHSSRSRL
jgi:hypothetical protein